MRLARELCTISIGVTFLYLVIITYSRGVGQIRLEQLQTSSDYDYDLTEKSIDIPQLRESSDDINPPAVPDDDLSLYPGAGVETDRIVEQLSYIPHTFPSTPLKILIWQGLDAWGGIKPQEGDEVFHRESCPVTSCLLTGDQRQLDSSDLVIFRERAVEVKKRKGQLWMIFTLESPPHSHITSTSLDWTATYRRDSTIVAPYGAWRRYEDPGTWQDVHLNFAENKTKQVAWMVSNCNAKNNRLEYAKELGNYIGVDIYGGCGTNRCGKKDQDCRAMLGRKYKFYLSFENSNCADYITEKFWNNALHHDMVPIVMGASIHDYEAVAPPNSFIHVDNFQGPEDLAKYLHVLDQDDDLYNEYFAWKGQGDFIATKFFCRVCSLLHYSKQFQQNKFDIPTWWSGPGVCQNKRL